MRQSHQQLGGAATNFRARRKLLISVRAARKWVQHVKGVITMLSLTGGDYSAGVAGDCTSAYVYSEIINVQFTLCDEHLSCLWSGENTSKFLS